MRYGPHRRTEFPTDPAIHPAAIGRAAAEKPDHWNSSLLGDVGSVTIDAAASSD
jgi:hypothetical protein